MKRGLGVWSMAGLLLTLSRVAEASNSASEIVALRHSWERAVEAEERGDWARAEQALSEAVGIKETPGLRYHLAHCREMQRKWVEALVDYKSAEEQILAGARAPDVEPLLRSAIERLEAKVPKLTIVVDEVAGLTLHIDGQPTSVKLLGRPIALNPGGHRIALSAPGAESAIRNITLEESETRTLPLTLVPRASSHVVDSHPFSAKPFVLLAEAGVALGALSFALYHRFEAEEGRQQGLTAFARKQDDMALGWAVGAGVLSAVVATTWLVWSDDDTAAGQAGVYAAQRHTHARYVRAARVTTGWSSVTLEASF